MEGHQEQERVAPTPGEDQQQQPAGMLESAELAEKHRQERGDPEPKEVGKSGFGRHYNIGGGRAEYGPTDTERMEQQDERNIEARVP